MGSACCVLGLGTSVASVVYGHKTAHKIYEAHQASGPAGVSAGDIAVTLLMILAFLGGWRTCTNGKRMIDAGFAPDEDAMRVLVALKTWKRSEKVGSPSLRFLTYILPVCFNGIFILGTYAVITLDAPLGGQVLLHYLSMTFMGMALTTTSANLSRFDGVDLEAPENAGLRAAARDIDKQPRSKARGFGLRLLAIWACGLGALMMIDAFVLLWQAQAGAATGWRVFYSLYAIFLFCFGLGVLTAGKSLLRHSRRHLTRVITSPADLRGESFVLYLRPFRNDTLQAAMQQDFVAGLPMNRPFTSGRSEEEQVAVAVKHIGPMVAVGRPGEPLPHVGAFRMYLPSHGWQEPVRELITQARLVVVALGPGEGTLWELREARRLLAPQRLILLIAMRADEYAQFRRSVVAETGGRVSEAANQALPPLPDYTGDPSASTIKAAIYYSPAWVPRFVLLAWSPRRLSSYRSHLLNNLQTKLRPAFEQLSWYEHGRGRR